MLPEWRTATGAVLPFLVAGLADDLPEVRYRATALLACLGAEAAPHADRIATLTADTAVRDSRRTITVGDAAVWALARSDDPRRLPSGGGLGPLRTPRC